MKDAVIIVATHKKYEMPKDPVYLPVLVGAKISKPSDYQRDDEGDNISEKNPYFCELTGAYWAFKNVKSKYIGLVHYRRYFTTSSKRLKTKEERLASILSGKQLQKFMDKNYDLILPKKRNYVIETLYSHYDHTLHIRPLDMVRNIIEKDYPEYLKEFDRIQKRHSAHMFNMMIGKKRLIDEYHKWLFDILFKLEREVEKEDLNKRYTKFHQRFYGRISELLFDVWLYTNFPETKKELENRYIKIKELRVIDIEDTNWLKKGLSFLLAKFTGKKYDKSF
ncbi:DUF4422 domain-containing protein [Candidatus Saccharibacteria bacterium]|nr:DUF4422 domain-containing protein [Candidatus Saccharibacteria bacterium]